MNLTSLLHIFPPSIKTEKSNEMKSKNYLHTRNIPSIESVIGEEVAMNFVKRKEYFALPESRNFSNYGLLQAHVTPNTISPRTMRINNGKESKMLSNGFGFFLFLFDFIFPGKRIEKLKEN